MDRAPGSGPKDAKYTQNPRGRAPDGAAVTEIPTGSITIARVMVAIPATPPPCRCPPTSAPGFTLLEMMVVLVIIGTVLGLAVLTLPDRPGQDPPGEEARRLEQLLRLARDQAMVRGSLLGLRLEDDGYRFLERRNDGWEELTGDPLLGPRELPEDLRLTLEVEGQGITSGRDAPRGPGEPAARPPQVLIAASGELTGFELVVAALGRGDEYLLRGTPSGRIELEAPTDD